MVSITNPSPPTALGALAPTTQRIHHACYIVEDIPAATEAFTRLYGTGPFVRLGDVVYDKVDSPFAGAMVDHSAVFGRWGEMFVELQDVRKVEPEQLQVKFTGAPRLHHIAYVVDDLQAESTRLEALGLPKFLYAKNGPFEVAYHDVPFLGHAIEVHQDNEPLRSADRQLIELAANWDGQDLIVG